MSNILFIDCHIPRSASAFASPPGQHVLSISVCLLICRLQMKHDKKSTAFSVLYRTFTNALGVNQQCAIGDTCISISGAATVSGGCFSFDAGSAPLGSSHDNSGQRRLASRRLSQVLTSDNPIMQIGLSVSQTLHKVEGRPPALILCLGWRYSNVEKIRATFVLQLFDRSDSGRS